MKAEHDRYQKYRVMESEKKVQKLSGGRESSPAEGNLNASHTPGRQEACE